MSGIRCYQVDAFTNQPFAGNPAAVCLMDKGHDKDDTWMQNVAAEMNLAETVFVEPIENGFGLRYFTPTMEVPLCGHATLATSHVLWTETDHPQDQAIQYKAKGGKLSASLVDNRIELDFPVKPTTETEPMPGLADALGVTPKYVSQNDFLTLVEIDSIDVLRTMTPDFVKLGQLPTSGVIVTCVSNDAEFDFYSRFFAPACGINEDPVCGSAHCSLTPYWSNKLGKRSMVAYQASSRGGILHVRLENNRVILGGQAVTVLKGELV